MKTTFKTMLNDAFNGGYAVPSISVSNLETIYGALEAAKAMKSPIILQVAPIQMENQQIDPMEFKNLVQVLHNRFQDVSYLVHLDHADTLDDCEKAIDAGFDSVMFDGSSLSLKKNIESTKAVRAYDRHVGLEAELGALNPEEGFSVATSIENAHFTDPDEAKAMLDSVDIDALAISFGNAHGFYQGEPKLDFELLKTIRETIHLPLVLHGGSGIGKDDIQRAVTLGISKINFFTQCDLAYRQAFHDSTKDGQYMMVGEKAAKEAFKACVETCIDLCLSGGKS
ncbi:MAG: class II fructose-bisphosphate aldolase [Bacillota bacterium]